MTYNAVEIYRCRNCGKEIIERRLCISSSEGGHLRDLMGTTDRYYSFFHQCNKKQVGFCELISRAVDEKELNRQKTLLKKELKVLEDDE